MPEPLRNLLPLFVLVSHDVTSGASLLVLSADGLAEHKITFFYN
jgi:hypothetical protein